MGGLRWTTLAVNPATPVGIVSGDLDGDGEVEIGLLAETGLWSYDRNGEFNWSMQLAHALHGVDWANHEYFGVGRTGVGVLLDLEKRAVAAELTLSSGGHGSMVPIEPGWFLARLQNGSTELVQPRTGTRIDTGVSTSAGIENMPWAMLPTRHPAEFRLLLATGYGFDELRVLGSDHVFGGSAGGFEP
jgi:hypothetical protein